MLLYHRFVTIYFINWSESSFLSRISVPRILHSDDDQTQQQSPTKPLLAKRYLYTKLKKLHFVCISLGLHLLIAESGQFDDSNKLKNFLFKESDLCPFHYIWSIHDDSIVQPKGAVSPVIPFSCRKTPLSETDHLQIEANWIFTYKSAVLIKSCHYSKCLHRPKMDGYKGYRSKSSLLKVRNVDVSTGSG